MPVLLQCKNQVLWFKKSRVPGPGPDLPAPHVQGGDWASVFLSSPSDVLNSRPVPGAVILLRPSERSHFSTYLSACPVLTSPDGIMVSILFLPFSFCGYCEIVKQMTNQLCRKLLYGQVRLPRNLGIGSDIKGGKWWFCGPTLLPGSLTSLVHKMGKQVSLCEGRALKSKFSISLSIWTWRNFNRQPPLILKKFEIFSAHSLVTSRHFREKAGFVTYTLCYFGQFT